jgi:predicted nucleotidyltransferase
MVEKVQRIGQEIKRAATQMYGRRFYELILFGSYARGDFHEESDVDIALVLNDMTISPATEILKFNVYSTEISLRNDTVISILPVTRERLKNSQLPVYQSIRNEGIVL